MSRPRGEVRAALLAVPVVHGPSTLRDLFERSNLGYDKARQTVQDCVRSGDLVVVGHERRPHAKRWVALYDVPEVVEAEPGHDAAAAQPVVMDGGLLVLGDAMARWR